MALKDNIKHKRKEHDLTLEEVAKVVGVTRQTVQKYESGVVSNIPSDKIELLAEVLRCTPAYLMGWEDEETSDILSVPGFEPPPKTYKVPRLGTIACGLPILAEENHEGYDEVPDDIRCDFTLKCKGDSMIDLRIRDGDVVYIRKQSDVDNGEVAAVIIDGEATLKKVFKLSKRLVLRAANPMFEDLEYEGEELKYITIAGKVVGFTSMFE